MDKELVRASEIAIKDCMGAQPGEKILVVSDVNKREIGTTLFDTAVNLGFDAIYMEMQPGIINGEEPPEVVAELMKKYDVVLAPLTKSITHTDARRNASKEGARIA